MSDPNLDRLIRRCGKDRYGHQLVEVNYFLNDHEDGYWLLKFPTGMSGSRNKYERVRGYSIMNVVDQAEAFLDRLAAFGSK